MQQKLLYTLLIASQKLHHYFQGHPIKVITDRPLETILRNPNITGRVAEWAMELQPFEISFKTTKVIKSKALAEFTAEWTDPFVDEPPEVESTLPGEETPGLWTMHFDGAFNLSGAGAGAILTSPSGDKLFYAVQLCFGPGHKVSNNIAEYEGLLAGLRAANALGIKRLIIKGDSLLILNFSNKSYTPKDEHMAAYLEEHRKMEKCFQGLELKHVPRGENAEADEIAKPASHRLAQPAGVFEERLFKPSASPSVSDPSLFLLCHRHQRRGLRIAGLLRATASFWRWHGRREWIGSSSSRPTSPAAGFPRMKRRPRGLCDKPRATASRTVTYTGAAQMASL
jgi:ribonuclease HI